MCHAYCLKIPIGYDNNLLQINSIFSRSLSQNILQRLLQFGSQPSGATNNNILNSLNYWPRNLPVYLTISGRVIVFGTWNATKWGKFDFARGNLSLQSTFGCNPQKLFSNWRVIWKLYDGYNAWYSFLQIEIIKISDDRVCSWSRCRNVSEGHARHVRPDRHGQHVRPDRY